MLDCTLPRLHRGPPLVGSTARPSCLDHSSIRAAPRLGPPRRVAVVVVVVVDIRVGEGWPPILPSPSRTVDPIHMFDMFEYIEQHRLLVCVACGSLYSPPKLRPTYGRRRIDSAAIGYALLLTTCGSVRIDAR